MDFWNILQKLKKCKNLTKSALGGVPCLHAEQIIIESLNEYRRNANFMSTCMFSDMENTMEDEICRSA